MSPTRLLNELADELCRSGPWTNPRKIYTATFLTFLRGFLIKEQSKDPCKDLIKKLGLDPTLKTLCSPFFKPMLIVKKLLDTIQEETLAIDTRSNVRNLLRRIAKELQMRGGSALLADALSSIEMVTLVVHARERGFGAKFLNSYFLNPAGVTSFLGDQVSKKGALKGYSSLLKRELGFAKVQIIEYSLSPDRFVHGDEFFSLKHFLERMPFEEFWNKARKLALKYDRVLITSDHGYSFRLNGEFIYIDHGVKEELDISALVPFILVWKR